MLVSDFDYDLPQELIAQHPTQRRDESLMMTLGRTSGHHEVHPFGDIVSYFRPGDCLVLNETRVIPARLWGHRPTGGRVEAFMLEAEADGTWACFLRPGRRLPVGSRVELDQGDCGGFTVVDKNAAGTVHVRFDQEDVLSILEHYGKIPLPPYISREPDPEDKERYQTVYARVPGAVAAPTAGLHFTEAILSELERRGVTLARLTLHVGAGTFRPVSCERVEDHLMHEESYVLPESCAAVINRTHEQGGRVFCVGTTTVRVLETCASETEAGKVVAGEGRTRIFLYPPRRPRVVDGLLTNFHLPQSTLLMLVCTFCEHDKVMAAYREAVARRLRFFSYGDCMLLLPEDGEAAR